ncbi:hypothetical protein EHQ19_08280 [Leptospira montravelensis]|uniref:hypothetical protein n=1 Tax=Leptospira montravelensis TaxID=2484961 RepID=UPI0010825F86|nr:hypothetical protein [Leptospira montravelensis]TGK82993.1 hypothetical protein EHQ19_08280 [Leptospira montravelensis]
MPAHNSGLLLRFGTSPRLGCAKLSSCHSLAYASYVPVPNVPVGTQGRTTSVSLVRYAQASKMINRIKINEELWIYFSDNKWLVGGINFPKNIHLTLHLGGNSGLIDLHLKNEKKTEYFTILTIDKNEIEEILSLIILNLLKILKDKIKTLTFREFKRDYKIFDYQILEKKISKSYLKDFLDFFGMTESKKTLGINFPQDNFRIPYNFNRLIKNHITQNKRRINVEELSSGTAIHKSGNNFTYFILNKQIFLCDSNSLEKIDQILIEAIGFELFENVMKRYSEGLEYLTENLNKNVNKNPIHIRIVKKEASA